MHQERMMEKLQEARRAFQKVESRFPAGIEEFLNMDELERDGIYKNIEYMIQNIIDICALLVKENDLGVPSSEEDVLARLAKGRILANGILSTIREMRGFRNFLVHRYGAIDERMAHKDIKDGLKDFPRVFSAIENAVQAK